MKIYSGKTNKESENKENMGSKNNGPTQEWTEKESQNFLLTELESTLFSLKRISEKEKYKKVFKKQKLHKI